MEKKAQHVQRLEKPVQMCIKWQPLFFKVDIDEIREKVEKASSSSYNFKEKPTAATMDEAPGQEKQIEKNVYCNNGTFPNPFRFPVNIE